MATKRVSKALADEIDKSLGLQMISIRLPRALIEDYKLLAQLRGEIYQPLMREALLAWADREKSKLLQGLAYDKRQQK